MISTLEITCTTCSGSHFKMNKLCKVINCGESRANKVKLGSYDYGGILNTNVPLLWPYLRQTLMEWYEFPIHHSNSWQTVDKVWSQYTVISVCFPITSCAYHALYCTNGVTLALWFRKDSPKAYSAVLFRMGSFFISFFSEYYTSALVSIRLP